MVDIKTPQLGVGKNICKSEEFSLAKNNVCTNLSGHNFLVYDEKIVMDFDCLINLHILDFIVIELQSGTMLAMSDLGLVEVDLQR
jgi:hypothetical protein